MALFLSFAAVNHSGSDRPFVPSVAPEDIALAEEIGVLTPRSVKPTDFTPKTFVKKPETWATRIAGSTAESKHAARNQKLVEEIEFLKMVDDNENIQDEAAEWLEKEIHFMNDQDDILRGCEFAPQKCSCEIKITRVEDAWSIGSINGHSVVYLPWGKLTNRNGPPAVKQASAAQHALRLNEFICVELEWNPRGQNFWKATKIYPKLPTSDMLVSSVETSTGSAQGFQYTYSVPCAPENIGSIIGSGGKNLNALIAYLHSGGAELPEVTIAPITPTIDEDHCFTFTPTLAQVRIFCPVSAEWDIQQVEELVSYMHC